MKRIKIEWRRLNLFRRVNELEERCALVDARIYALRRRVKRLEEAMSADKKSRTAEDIVKAKEMEMGVQDGNAARPTDILRGGVKDAEREADANRVLNEFLLFPEELDRMKEGENG